MNSRKKATQTKAVAKPKKEELLFCGGQRLFGDPLTEKEQKERKSLDLSSRVLQVSIFGVNILGGGIYLNKLGLAQKVNQYEPKASFEYEWVKIAENDDDKAVCKCRIRKGENLLCDWVLGECSTQTMSMKTLKGYQNHMAQTRAKNRAILEAFGVRIHEEMLMNVEKLHRQMGKKGEELPSAKIIVNASVEEMQTNGNGSTKAKAIPQRQTKVSTLPASDDDKLKIFKLLKEIGKTDDMTEKKASQLIFKTLAMKVEFESMTKTQAGNIIAQLLQKQVDGK